MKREEGVKERRRNEKADRNINRFEYLSPDYYLSVLLIRLLSQPVSVKRRRQVSAGNVILTKLTINVEIKR